MAICDGCGASFGDNNEFCPFCGKGKVAASNKVEINNNGSILCPKCNFANPIDNSYCQQCGEKLTRICRGCGANNLLVSIFCKSCGIKLSEAKLKISFDKAKEWWSYFQEFPEMWKMTTPDGLIKTRFIPIAKQMINSITDLPNIGKTAFYVPICDKDYCIKLVQIVQKKINNGFLWVGSDAFYIFDFTEIRVYPFFYDEMNKVFQENDLITLVWKDDTIVSFSVRVPHPSKSSIVGKIALGTILMLGSKSEADSDVHSRRIDRQIEDFGDKVNTASKYVESIYKYFAEIHELGKGRI